jgi:SAM-dependent methyltransferase
MKTTSQEALATQRERYNAEADAYAQHHGSDINQKYRDRFIRSELFGFDLDGRDVLDAMSASGLDTAYLLGRNASVTGLDIAEGNARLYRELWGRECRVASIHDTGFPDRSFDVVYIGGGLHHVIPFLEDAIVEVHRILRDRGRFVFVEPNRDTWLDVLRRLWYRVDPRFQESEAALSYRRDLRPHLSKGFEEERVSSGGNVAYLFICQSLVFRTPQVIKRHIYRPLFGLENLLNSVPGVPKLFFTAVWQKVQT